MLKNKNSIWVGIAHMGIGTILAQLINVVAQPVLTRLFSPDILGVYTYIISMATMIIPVANLKMDMLVVSESDDAEAQYITDVCIGINIIIFIVYSIVIAIGYIFPGENLFNKYGLLIFVVPVLVFTNGIRFLFISYLNRYKQYKTISVVAFVREGIRAILQIAAGVAGLGAFSLSMGYAVSPLFGLKIQMKNYILKLKHRERISITHAFDIIRKKGRKQILYLVPAQFINSFSASLITISITALFSAKTLGYYSAGVRILDVPIVFITANVSKVCYQKVSECVSNKQPVLKIIRSVALVLIVTSIMGFGLLYIIAPRVSEILFGTGYSVAGEYIRCLCMMYAVRFVATSFAGIYTVFQKQQFELILNIMLIVSAVLSYIVSNSLNCGIITYLNIMNISYSVVYIVMLIGYIVLCRKHDKTIKPEEQ